MATFSVYLGRTPLGHYVAERGMHVIGRSLDAGIVIDDDTVSRQHALIKREGSAWLIQNTGGQNGMFVNGVFKEFHVFKNGDQVELGRAIVVYRAGTITPDDGAPLKTLGGVQDQRGGMPLKPTNRLTVEEIQNVHQRNLQEIAAHIAWLDRDGKRQSLIIAGDRPVVMGWGKSADIELGLNLLEGRRVVEIRRVDASYALFKLSPRTRVLVDGVTVLDHAPLKEGAKIEVRDRSFIFHDRLLK